MPCTADDDVKNAPAFVPSQVPAAWLEAALGLSEGAIASVESKVITAGGSPIPKCLITVAFAGEDASNSRCRHFFAKLASGKGTGVPDMEMFEKGQHSVAEQCYNAHQREAAFYRHITGQGDAETLSFFPTCFHASSEVILLENPTLNRSYEAVCAWKFTDSAPDLPVLLLRRALTALAAFHCGFWAVGEQPSPHMMNWLELSDARLLRMRNAGVETAAQQLERVLAACRRTVNDDSLQQLCEKALGVGLKKLWARCLPNKEHASFCHGDSNPGNLIAEKAESGDGVLLIDFQEPIYQGPGSSDVARLVVSGLSPASRREHWEGLLRHYHTELSSRLAAKGVAACPTFEETRTNFLYSLLADAVFIAAVVPEACFGNPATRLLHDVAERSVHVLEDLSSEFTALLE